ncbi:MAG: GAF domain-containing sensor histidine kinase [Caldilineaceae bacterium]|nr:GAF domain-containing sensor histidine kinase [Caldilineaceae bacterium]
MNAVSTFLSDRIIYIYFFYGLAFFSLGLALQVTARRQSAFRFAVAIMPLALFGYLHGAHEWLEMFMVMERRAGAVIPPAVDVVRLALLVTSFLALIAFSARLDAPAGCSTLRRYRAVWILAALWVGALIVIGVATQTAGSAWIDLGDVLARYILAVPGALLAARALMTQQRTFRAENLFRFGRDLIWCAVVLVLYGAVSQLFVRPLDLPPASFLNSGTFLAWFGIPVQLFRTVLAILLTVYMVRVLRVFDVENRRRLDEAGRMRIEAQSDALATERRNLEAIAELNHELRVTTRELALVVELANLLGMPMPLHEKLADVLARIVDSLHSTDAGLILLADTESSRLHVAARTGFINLSGDAAAGSRYDETLALAERSVAERQALCRHADDQVLAMAAEFEMLEQLCRAYASPTITIALPLATDEHVIGSLALARARDAEDSLTAEELQLLTGIAHQLGLSIHNARLSQQARQREERLAEMLRAVVSAQESERQRIARELHDATGQTLTAIALGLRGTQTLAAGTRRFPSQQLAELEGFATTALGELRQIIADLRPPQLDELGLAAALRWYAQEFSTRHKLTVHFDVEGTPEPLPGEYEIVLFRTTQEALTNVAKHAAAQTVIVTLSYTPSHVSIRVEDDGRGFPSSAFESTAPTAGAAGWGLLGIRERAVLLGGRSRVESRVDQGTAVYVEVPRPNHQAQPHESSPLHPDGQTGAET